MNPEDEYPYNITDINVHSFNNKADKGDDDFEDWLINEAPFKMANESTITLTNTYDTSDSITFTPGTTLDTTNKKYEDLKYSMPIDLMYKWFGNIEKDDFDDEIPF